MRQKKCLICNYDLEYYLDGYDLLYKTTKKVFKIYKCKNCSLEQIMPPPNNNEIISFYPDNYYSYNQINGEKNFFQKLREKIIDISYNNNNSLKNMYYFLALFSKHLLDGIPLKYIGNKKFLDVGCGDGYNLSLLYQYGWDVTGFELGISGKDGNIYYGPSLEQIDFDNKKFDFIRVWHVLEHVPNPNPFVSKLATLLSENGHLIIGLPNTNSLYAKLFRQYWYNRDIPRHLINYNPSNLKILLENHGLKIVKIKYSSLGGLLGSIQHFLNQKFNLKINLIDNRFLLILFFPLDFICNIFHIGDCISLDIIRQTV